MKIHPFITPAVFAALLLPVCSWASDVSRADKAFMVKAAENGQLEVDASTAAKTNAASPAVKDFAAMMVTDHTKMAQDLKTLADAKGVSIPIQPALDQQTKIHQMSLKTGPAFDKAYVQDVGVKSHEETIALFKVAAKSAQDPEVKAFAAQSLPSLEQHLQQAKSLQSATSSMQGMK